jgi:ABC-2 type transport system permease protein
MSTIYILWIRQLKRYFRSPARIVSSIGQPLLFLVAFGFGFGPIFQKAGGGNYIEFLAPGIIAMSILFTAMSAGMETIWDKEFGFLKETLVAPVSRFSIMLGKTAGGATVAVMQGIIVLIISLFAGFHFSAAMFPLAFLFMIGIALIFTAFGIAIATVVDDMHAFPLVINLIVMPTFFLSGALFPLEGLPALMTDLARLNPLSYGIDGLRTALTQASHFNLGTDVVILASVTFLFLALGSYLFSRVQA